MPWHLVDTSCCLEVKCVSVWVLSSICKSAAFHEHLSPVSSLRSVRSFVFVSIFKSVATSAEDSIWWESPRMPLADCVVGKLNLRNTYGYDVQHKPHYRSVSERIHRPLELSRNVFPRASFFSPTFHNLHRRPAELHQQLHCWPTFRSMW